MIKILEHRCDTCTKRFPHAKALRTGCQVLTDSIGEREPCWAWSDDPEWEAKVNAALIECYGHRGASAISVRKCNAKKKGVR